MSKYDTKQAEALYGETPDEEAGSSTEGVGWYGFYREEGIVLYESTQGFVHTFFDIDQAGWDEFLLISEY